MSLKIDILHRFNMILGLVYKKIFLFKKLLIFHPIVADIAMDWSDHAMWWPEKNIWLDKTRWTLDQYNITADAQIHFTPMHKTLRIQLPDLRYIDCNVDFSIKTFNASVNLCRELGIRHPEELSLSKPLEPEHLKQNYQETVMRRKPPPPTKEANTGERIDTNTFILSNGDYSRSNGSLNGTLRSPRTPSTLPKNGKGYHSNPVSKFQANLTSFFCFNTLFGRQICSMSIL